MIAGCTLKTSVGLGLGIHNPLFEVKPNKFTTYFCVCLGVLHCFCCELNAPLVYKTKD